MQQGKQYSFWHKLPKDKNTLISIIPRSLIKDKNFLNTFSVKTNLPLFLFVSHYILNQKTSSSDIPMIEIKRSALRNFIGKKIHSQKASVLDKQLDEFLYALSKSEKKSIYFEVKNNKILFSFYDIYYKKLSKGNTVSLNIYDLTSLRGEKAKLMFLNVLSFDLRQKSKYVKMSHMVNFLSLSFNKRASNIQKIKRCFKSLMRKGLVKFMNYVGLSNTKESYRFNYELLSLHQTK